VGAQGSRRPRRSGDGTRGTEERQGMRVSRTGEAS
jgi:hypothetical protein